MLVCYSTLGEKMMASMYLGYGLLVLVVIVIVVFEYLRRSKGKKDLNSNDCQAVQVELYRQTTYLIGELKMELDELRGALSLAQSEAEALKAANANLLAENATLKSASPVPDDIAAQANQLVSTLAPN